MVCENKIIEQKTNASFSITLFLITLLNISYLFINKTKMTALLVGFALLTFFSLLILSKKLKASGWIFSADHIATRSNIACLFILILPFFIPLILYPFHPQIIFWKFNNMGRIALSWFTFSLIWLNLRRNINLSLKESLPPFLLFVIWGTLLWLNLIWDVGLNVIFRTAVEARLSLIYKIWEAKPFTEHFGLAFSMYDNFKDYAYSGHSQIYLLIHYLTTKCVQFFLHWKMEEATKITSFFYSGLLIITVVFYFIKTDLNFQINKFKTQITFLLGLGFLISIPDYWLTLLRNNTMDNVFPLMIYFVLMLFSYVMKDEYFSKGFILLLYLFCLIIPISGIICLFTLCFFKFSPGNLDQDRGGNFKKNLVLGIGFLLALVAFMYPIVIIKILGYRHWGSSLITRSGLDGDISYYHNIIQAVLNPICMSRASSAIIPAIVFLIISFIFGGREHWIKNKKPLSNIIFLFSPYLFSIVFFPQSVSIHPYLYDYLFIFPISFLGVCWSCSPEFQEKNSGPWAYLFFLFMMSLIIYNLTMIAQVAKKFPL